MSEQRPNILKFITPRGVTIYPRFNKPDTGPKNKPHEPQFKTKLKFGNDGVFIFGKTKVSTADTVAKLEELRDELYAETEAKLKQEKDVQKRKKALAALSKRPVFQPVYDESEQETDELILNCKMKAEYKDKKTEEIKKRKLPIFSAKGGEPLKNPPQVGGGSEVKLGLTAMAYYMASTGEVGVTFYLDSVQLLKVVEYQGRDAAAYGFEAEDGYEGDETNEAGFSDETKDADDSTEGGAENDDF